VSSVTFSRTTLRVFDTNRSKIISLRHRIPLTTPAIWILQAEVTSPGPRMWTVPRDHRAVGGGNPRPGLRRPQNGTWGTPMGGKSVGAAATRRERCHGRQPCRHRAPQGRAFGGLRTAFGAPPWAASQSALRPAATRHRWRVPLPRFVPTLSLLASESESTSETLVFVGRVHHDVVPNRLILVGLVPKIYTCIILWQSLTQRQ